MRARADLRDWATRIAVRRGKGMAVVALARRLAGILFALLRDGTVYEPRRRAPPIVPQPVAAADAMINAISPGFAGWVSANVAWAAVAEPPHRWRPHPSTPLMRR